MESVEQPLKKSLYDKMDQEIAAKLEELRAQLKGISNELKEVSQEMIAGKFTKTPVFVAHTENAQIGELLFDRAEYGFPYSINETTLERLNELNIIQKDKNKEFIKAAGDPQKQYALLWLAGAHSQFIFVPF